jgi:hypothetical protein
MKCELAPPMDLMNALANTKGPKGTGERERYLFYLFSDLLVCGTVADAKRKQMLEVLCSLAFPFLPLLTLKSVHFVDSSQSSLDNTP